MTDQEWRDVEKLRARVSGAVAWESHRVAICALALVLVDLLELPNVAPRTLDQNGLLIYCRRILRAFTEGRASKNSSVVNRQ